MGRINVTSRIFCGAFGLQHSTTYVVVLTLIAQGWLNVERIQTGLRRRRENLDSNKEKLYGTEQ